MLVGNGLFLGGFTVAPADGSLEGAWLSLLILGAIVVLGTEVWYLLQKRRSLFYLFLNLLSWIGFIILLSLGNKATVQAPEENNAEPKVAN